MSSFSCPHLNTEDTFCTRLIKDCIPGRPGCVLSKKFVFAIPVEERIKQREKEKQVVKNKR